MQILIDGEPVSTLPDDFDFIDQPERVPPPASLSGTITMKVTGDIRRLMKRLRRLGLGTRAPVRKRPRRVQRKIDQRGGYTRHPINGAMALNRIGESSRRLAEALSMLSPVDIDAWTRGAVEWRTDLV